MHESHAFHGKKSIIVAARVYFRLSTKKESYDMIDYCSVLKFTGGWSKTQCYSIETIPEASQLRVYRVRSNNA